MFIIEYKGRLFMFEHPDDIVSETIFFDRCWFIARNSEHKDVNEYADLWISHKYFGTCYDIETMNTLKHFT